MPEIINQQTSAVPSPEDQDDVIAPFEVRDVPRRWLRKFQSHRIKLPTDYNDMVDRLDRDDLIAHIRLRREHTGEDLAIDGSTPDLRRQIYIGDQAQDVDASGDGVYQWQTLKELAERLDESPQSLATSASHYARGNDVDIPVEQHNDDGDLYRVDPEVDRAS